MTTLLLAFTLCAGSEPEIATQVWQVAPPSAPYGPQVEERPRTHGGAAPWVPPAAPAGPRAEVRRPALVLIPGLHIHPLRPAKALTPELRDWQKPKSKLVKELGADFDVFAFGYAQTAPVEAVADSAGLRDCVANLRKAGYTEIVLVGHSAGAVIARQFACQNPGCGVTKVIAVAAPFEGAKAADAKMGVPKVQAPFVKSLSPTNRKGAERNAPPDDLGFACVVCKVRRLESDGLVPLASQWPEDLQQLGVPAALVRTSHITAMDDADTARLIHELAKGKLARWSAAEVAQARKVLFGEN